MNNKYSGEKYNIQCTAAAAAAAALTLLLNAIHLLTYSPLRTGRTSGSCRGRANDRAFASFIVRSFVVP